MELLVCIRARLAFWSRDFQSENGIAESLAISRSKCRISIEIDLEVDIFSCVWLGHKAG